MKRSYRIVDKKRCCAKNRYLIYRRLSVFGAFSFIIASYVSAGAGQVARADTPSSSASKAPSAANSIPTPHPYSTGATLKAAISSAATVIHVGTSLPARAPTFREPEVQINRPSLEQQKRFAAAGALGRQRSGTLLFTEPKLSPQPTVSATMVPSPMSSLGIAVGVTRKLTLTAPLSGYSQDTGIKRTGSRPMLPEHGPLRNVAVELMNPGGSDSVVPPDTQLSVGRNFIVQMNNESLTIWRKGDKITKVAAIPLRQAKANDGGLFPVTGNYEVGDPWIIYDSDSNRWIASAMLFDPDTYDSAIYIAVSSTDNPAQDWSLRKLNIDSSEISSSVLHDQPKLGITRDKILIAWTDYKIGDEYLGGRWIAYPKADILSSSVAPKGVGPAEADLCLAQPIPVRNLGSAYTGYILSSTVPGAVPSCNGAIPPPSANTGNVIKVVQILGTLPSVVTRTYNLQVAEYSAPPDITQYNSGAVIDAGDTRLVSSAWDHDRLWMVANGACKVSDGGARACFRLVQITTTPMPHVVRDVNVSSNDRDLLYPSLSIDADQDVIAGAIEVTKGTYVGAAVFARLEGHDDWQLLTAANGKYPVEFPTECSNGGKERIGDYSGADRDPTESHSVWLALQTSTSTGCKQDSILVRSKIK